MLPTFILFGRTIGLYPLMAIVGGLCAGTYAMQMAKRRTGSDQPMLELLLWAAVGTFLGGALLYSIINIQNVFLYWRYVAQPYTAASFLGFLRLLFGGSVFYGGLIGGLLGGALYARRTHLPFATYADIAAPAIPLFHTFGRIGCFLGGCCYGVPWARGVTFTHSLVQSANGVPRFPVQLLEASFNVLLFALLAWLLANNRLQGRLLPLYLLLYPSARFGFEYLRGDAYRGFLLGLSTSQCISLVLVVSITGYMLLKKRKKKEPS